jgi:hypothetical protein
MTAHQNSPTFDRFLERTKPLVTEGDLARLQSTVTRLLGKAIVTYEAAYGLGEVGKNGQARVLGKTDVETGNTGLLYGKVQSGKTAASIGTVALGADSGFRTFVLVTSDNLWLGKQTYDRFLDGLTGGPLVLKWTEWATDIEGTVQRAKSYIASDGVLFVSTKNVRHLEALRAVLKSVKAGDYPSLVMDDEADNASLNTAEASGADPSGVFVEIGKIRKLLPHHVYIQVTATPQSLLLQGIDHPCRPQFSELLKPGDGYVGGEILLEDGSPYCGVVEGTELQVLQGKVGHAASIPQGLRQALSTFLVGSAFKQQTRPEDRYSFLAHVCYKKINHEILRSLIRDYLLDLDKAVSGLKGEVAKEKALLSLDNARAELLKTAPDLPSISQLLPRITEQLRQISPEIVNADNKNAEPTYRKGMNILIGGNRLGRGVTIPGLIVTYYGRDAKQKMMDTVHQHARMFGYRAGLLDVTRFYTSKDILETFRNIHEADEGMREAIADDEGSLLVKPVWVGPSLKPTRSNVLNPSEIGAFSPGIQVFPPQVEYRKEKIASLVKQLEVLLSPYQDDETYHAVPIDLLIEILGLTKSIPHEGYSWRDDRVMEALKALKSSRIDIGMGRLNVRRGKNAEGLNLTRPLPPAKGYADSGWVRTAKEKYSQQPTLLMLKQRGERSKGWDNQPLYIPVLVMPKIKYAITFNVGD